MDCKTCRGEGFVSFEAGAVVKRCPKCNGTGSSKFNAICEHIVSPLTKELAELRTANQRLEGEVARLTLAIANQTVRHFVGDDDQRQMDELVAAGIRADQQEIKRLREALAGLVKINELHNQAVVAVTGKPGGWNDDYLNEARAALSTNAEVAE